MSTSAFPAASPRTDRAAQGDKTAMRRWRVKRTRRRVAAFAATLLATLWLVVFVQLVSGHDPALTANAKHRASATAQNGTSSTAASTAGASSGSSAGSSGSSAGSSGSSASSSGSSSTQLSPVTTGQS